MLISGRVTFNQIQKQRYFSVCFNLGPFEAILIFETLHSFGKQQDILLFLYTTEKHM